MRVIVEKVETIISIIGSLASVIGIILTYRQVKAVKSVAEAAKEASEQTQQSVLNSFSLGEASKFCESILIIQQALQDDEIRFAIHLCNELKTVLVEIQAYLKATGEYVNFPMTGHIQSLNNNILNMQKCLPGNKYKLRKDKIIQDLENLHHQLSEIQAHFKTKR